MRWVISSQPIAGWPVVQTASRSSPSGTASWRAAGWSCGSTSWTGSRSSSWRSRPGGSRHGWCCQSSPIAMSTSPVRERGQRLLGLGLDQLAAQLGRGLRRAPPSRAATIRSATDWNVAIRTRPATVPDAAARSASARAARSSSASACSTSTSAGIGQPHAAAGALEQAHAGLALEHRELLGDGARRELERVGDRGDRAALVELLQQAQASELEHACSDATDSALEIGIAPDARVGHDASHAGPLFCLGSGAAFGAMAVFGKLAYDEGATVGTLLAVRFSLAALLFWAGGRRRARCRALGRAATSSPGSRSAPAATRCRPACSSRRWSGSTRRCCRCCSTRSRRWSRSRPSCSGASGWTGGAWARSCWPRAAARGRRGRRGGRARAARRRAGPDARRRSTARTSWSATGSRRGVPPLVLAALVCTGAAVSLTVGSAAARASCARAS